MDIKDLEETIDEQTRQIVELEEKIRALESDLDAVREYAKKLEDAIDDAWRTVE
jgi:cell division protein FtsB